MKFENKTYLRVLVGRVLCRYIKCLQPLSELVPKHIPYQHQKEMSKKSETYFLDVLMKNEVKHSDMVDIMTAEHDYLG